jgi:hypothetical protein
MNNSFAKPKQLVLMGVACLTLSLTGCDSGSKDRFQIQKDGDRTIRLDKQTGEIAVLENGVLTSAKDAAAAKAEAGAMTENLAKPRAYDSTELPTLKLRVTCTTSWRDGTLLYKVRFFDPVQADALLAWLDAKDHSGPVPALAPGVDRQIRLARAEHTFTLVLYDENGFTISKIPLAGSIALNIDEQGHAEGFEAEGASPMTSEQYLHVKNWNVFFTGA